MRADRLLSILMLLQAHRRMTAGELARRLEVSERTIHRDMGALSGAGVPVMAERGSGGGWGLLDGYQTRLTGLNAAEIQTLFLTRPPQALADLGLRKAGEAALIKLFAALPSWAAQGAEQARQRLHVDAAGWHRPDDASPYLPVLQDAIWRERRLAFAYPRGDGTAPARIVDPLGLVAKGSVWYLVAAVEDGALRTYRVSRMRDAHALDAGCVRPAGFDLAAYWEHSQAEFIANLPRFDATLRVAPDALDQLRAGGRYTRVERVDPPDADGWHPVAMRFEEEHNAAEFVVGFGARVEVVAPATLRASVIELARSVVAFYTPWRERAPAGDRFA
jgi:predicted DNA-binding transcriptional regulator YafY